MQHQPGGHQVVVVEHLDESLDLGPLGHLLLAHGGGHFAGVAVDAGDQSVTVRTVGCAVIDVLKADDTCLLLPGSRYRCGTRLEGVRGQSHQQKGSSYLNDDGFAAGVASSQDHHHLPRLHELAHF